MIDRALSHSPLTAYICLSNALPYFLFLDITTYTLICSNILDWLINPKISGSVNTLSNPKAKIVNSAVSDQPSFINSLIDFTILNLNEHSRGLILSNEMIYWLSKLF